MWSGHGRLMCAARLAAYPPESEGHIELRACVCSDQEPQTLTGFAMGRMHVELGPKGDWL
jgi:hypothetical protein